MKAFNLSRPGVLRLLRHIAFAITGTLIVNFVIIKTAEYESMARMSLGAAYASLVFWAATLLLGSYYVLRKKDRPLSSNLRRDLGIWTAFFALLHTYVGFQVYGSLRFWEYFLEGCNEFNDLCLRLDLFAYANHVGLIAAIILLGLLIISNNQSIKILTAKRWQAAQKFVYVAAVLSVIHGVSYQLLEERMFPLVVALFVLVLFVVIVKLWSLRVVRD